MAEQEQARRLDAFVVAGIKGATSKSHHVPHERCFTLPLAARKQFGDFLTSLEASKQDLNVRSPCLLCCLSSISKRIFIT